MRQIGRSAAQPTRGGWGEIDFSTLSQRAGGLFQGGFWLACGAAGIGLLALLLTEPGLLAPYLAIVGPALAGIALWAWSQRQGLPLLPLFLVQQALIYAVPVATRHPEAVHAPPGTLLVSGLSVGLFLTCLVGGWRGGQLLVASRPSRGNIALDARSGRGMSLAFALLGVALVFHLATRGGVLFKLLPGPLEGLFPVIRTFATMASMLGAMIGGLVVGGRPHDLQSWMYWSLLTAIGVLAAADVLLSAASGLVLSAGVGLALGMRRVPWGFLLTALVAIGFLNQGKFVMRERYWGQDANTTSISLLQLPGFYSEWLGVSGGMLFEEDENLADGAAFPDEGQSILARINNIQNMTFVVEALGTREITPLWGKTYALIPPLLVPRVFWPNKPRTHEGQVLLNLHFERQATVEQTEQTYVAWGLLPEAVGNFGIWLGPVFGGLVFGFVIGLLERISRHKRLLSVEGMVLAALMLLAAGSYEMVASVFITALFQALVAVTIGGFVLMWRFGAAPPAAFRRRRGIA